MPQMHGHFLDQKRTDVEQVDSTKVVEFLEKRTEPPSDPSLEHGKVAGPKFQEIAHFRRGTYGWGPQGRARPNNNSKALYLISDLIRLY